ncbi:hypothetical protein [Stenotrophomonas sp. Marseille-Q4652]|uniref:hypothetical protein n=1 Tax=Stenotrophomonas sp. Marseille-Q4652 TaxID=2866595 RepID=UPI001CE47533|nr:hypothetical protein [Stenotrophomonas sp. Marseille-Q4652]
MEQFGQAVCASSGTATEQAGSGTAAARGHHGQVVDRAARTLAVASTRARLPIPLSS